MKVDVVSLKVVRDRSVTAPRTISGALDVVRLWQTLQSEEPDREELWLFCLDGCRRPTKITMVSRGDRERAIATPREVFKTAILANAKYIIVVQNHPSGDPNPTEDDRWITDVLWHAGQILGIPLFDHVIVTHDAHYSAATEQGWEVVGYNMPTSRQATPSAEREEQTPVTVSPLSDTLIGALASEHHRENKG